MNILIVCVAGLSSSFLVTKMKKYALGKNEVPLIESCNYDKIEDFINDYEYILIGPQLAHKFDVITEKYHSLNKKFLLIDPMDFGLCKVENIFNKINLL